MDREVTIGELAMSTVRIIRASATAQEATRRLGDRSTILCVVDEDEQVVGTVTRADLERLAEKGNEPVSSVMNDKIHAICEDFMLDDVATGLRKNDQVDAIPVFSSNLSSVVGVVRREHLMEAAVSTWKLRRMMKDKGEKKLSDRERKREEAQQPKAQMCLEVEFVGKRDRSKTAKMLKGHPNVVGMEEVGECGLELLLLDGSPRKRADINETLVRAGVGVAALRDRSRDLANLFSAPAEGEPSGRAWVTLAPDRSV